MNLTNSIARMAVTRPFVMVLCNVISSHFSFSRVCIACVELVTILLSLSAHQLTANVIMLVQAAAWVGDKIKSSVSACWSPLGYTNFHGRRGFALNSLARKGGEMGAVRVFRVNLERAGLSERNQNLSSGLALLSIQDFGVVLRCGAWKKGTWTGRAARIYNIVTKYNTLMVLRLYCTV